MGWVFEGKVSFGLIALFAGLVAVFFLPVASFNLALVAGNLHGRKQLQVSLQLGMQW